MAELAVVSIRKAKLQKYLEDGNTNAQIVFDLCLYCLLQANQYKHNPNPLFPAFFIQNGARTSCAACITLFMYQTTFLYSVLLTALETTPPAIQLAGHSSIPFTPTNITTNRKGFTPPNAVLKPWIYSVFQNSRISVAIKKTVFRKAAKKPPTK